MKEEKIICPITMELNYFPFPKVVGRYLCSYSFLDVFFLKNKEVDSIVISRAGYSLGELVSPFMVETIKVISVCIFINGIR